MEKLTLIISMNDSGENPSEYLDGILSKSLAGSQIICLSNKWDDIQESYENKDISFYKSSKNLADKINGEYVLFVDVNKKFKESSLNDINKRLLDNPADIIIYNGAEDSLEDDDVFSSFDKNNTNYNKLDLLFKMDDTIFNKLYNRDFIINNEFDFELAIKEGEYFNFITILNAKQISLTNQTLYEKAYVNALSLTQFENYLKTQNNIMDLVYDKETYLTDQINNYKINNSIRKLQKVYIEYKKEAFRTLRKDYINILRDEKVNDFVNSLSKDNRKAYEQVIIAESIEEYDLLKSLSKDKNYINYMNRYEKIISTEHKKIKNFNDSLKSSNSWKLTKILRFKR